MVTNIIGRNWREIMFPTWIQAMMVITQFNGKIIYCMIDTLAARKPQWQ